MSEKPGSSVEGQEAEEPVDSEAMQEPSGAKSREIDGASTDGDASSSSSGLASETVEVDPPVQGGGLTDSDIDLNADTVTQRGAGTYDTHSTDLTEDAVAGWQEDDLVADQYRIQRLIGQGGMGKVYLAQDEALDRPVALKRIPQEILFDEDARDDLRLEANRLLDLAHDNIVRIHTYTDRKKKPDGPQTWPFFAMEYLEGQTLKQFLRQRKREGRRFDAEELLVIARQVGDGLAHAHAHNVVHRDLKPANLMLAKPVEGILQPSDTIKITDFGISRVVADSTLRQTGKRSGTIPYMSPEQFRGELSTPSSDIYSLACTLYELSAGSPPFYTGDIGYQIMNIEPAPLEGLPRIISETILRGLSKDAEDRFESAEEFVAAIEGRKIPRSGRKRSGTMGLVSKMFAGLLFAFAVFWWASSGGDFPGESEGLGNTGSTGSAAGLAVPPGLPPATGVEVSGLPERKPETPVEKKTRTDAFRAWLGEVLQKQLPLNIGRDYGELAAGGIPAIDITLAFTKSEAPDEGEMLDDLVFLATHAGDAETADSHQVRGQLNAENGVFSFHFRRLVGGSYSFAAFVEDREKGLAVFQGMPLLERQLVIDLISPTFDLAAADPIGLVDSASEGTLEFTTFEELVRVRLNIAGSTDIKEVWYSLLTPDGASSEERKIEDISDWEINYLTPGESRTARVYAIDKAGNRSETMNVIFKRLKIELEEFRTVEIVGNLAKVEGRFKVEGSTYPDLQFSVNGERVDVEWAMNRPPPAEKEEGARVGEEPLEDDAEPAIDNPVLEESVDEESVVGKEPELAPGATRAYPFVADIPLSKSVNVVSVQYSWKERPAVSFGEAGTLDRVQARAPLIVLRLPALDPLTDDKEEPGADETGRRAIYTRDTTLTVEGELDVVFDGLKVVLLVQNSFGESKEEMAVVPVATGTGGRFKKDIELQPAVATRVEVRCFYNNLEAELANMAEPLEVYCDQEAPTAKVRTSESGDQLVVFVQVNEKLKQLRGRLGSSEGGGTDPWIDILVSKVLETGEPEYAWSIPLQERAVPILLELTDLAGNVSERRHDYSPPIDEPMPEAGKLPVKPVAAAPVRAGTIILRSRFLREVGMDFIVCGPTRLEMCKTEISESCWFRFLNEKGLRGPDERIGKRENPMALSDQPIELVGQFVKWFEEQAADGYTYSLPTVEQWLRSFTGARTEAEATREIRSWFSEDGEFVFQQSERYGQNKVSAIGERSENATSTGLLDMESNLQEIVLTSQGLHVVIGGHNQLDDPERLSRACTMSRSLDEDQRELLGGFTGFRICRKPVSGR